MTIDLAPAAARLAALTRGVRDDQLADPTPCPDYTVGDLLDHIGGLSLAFTAAATKAVGEGGGPSGDASRLGDDWRERIPASLDGLAAAWRDPAAWEGMTRAGGFEMPAEVGGLVALDELVLHGWDLAVATEQPFAVDDVSLDVVHGFVGQFAGPGHEADRAGLFGTEIAVDDDAPLLDRVLAMAGRDPRWPVWT